MKPRASLCSALGYALADLWSAGREQKRFDRGLSAMDLFKPLQPARTKRITRISIGDIDSNVVKSTTFPQANGSLPVDSPCGQSVAHAALCVRWKDRPAPKAQAIVASRRGLREPRFIAARSLTTPRG